MNAKESISNFQQKDSMNDRENAALSWFYGWMCSHNILKTHKKIIFLGSYMLICSLLCIALNGKHVTGRTPVIINDKKALKPQPINGGVGGNKAQEERVIQETSLGLLFSKLLCKLKLAGMQLDTHFVPNARNQETSHVPRMKTHLFSRWTVSTHCAFPTGEVLDATAQEVQGELF